MHANKIDKTKCFRKNKHNIALTRGRNRCESTKDRQQRNKWARERKRAIWEIKWKIQVPNVCVECEIKALPYHIKYAFFHFSRKPDVQPLVARANFSLFVCSHHFASIIYETLFTPQFRSMSCILHSCYVMCGAGAASFFFLLHFVVVTISGVTIQ